MFYALRENGLSITFPFLSVFADVFHGDDVLMLLGVDISFFVCYDCYTG